MRTEIAVPRGIDLQGVFDFQVPRAVPGVEIGEPGRHARALTTPEGVVGLDITAAEVDGAPGLSVRTTRADVDGHARVVERVRRLFDLDADARTIDGVLASHPLVSPLVVQRPGIRVPRVLVAEEALIRALIGQQISVAAARLALTELSVLGEPVDVGIEGVDRLFPTASSLAERGGELLRAPVSRRETLASVSAALADGSLELGTHVDPAALREQLLGMRGIGPWTVGYVSLFALGDPDVMLPGDSAIRLGARTIGVDPAAVVAFSAYARPWRSYLAMHLWRASGASAAARSAR